MLIQQNKLYLLFKLIIFKLLFIQIFNSGFYIFSEEDPIIATVKLIKSEKITLSQYEEKKDKYEKAFRELSFDFEMRKELLMTMINKIIILQAIERGQRQTNNRILRP